MNKPKKHTLSYEGRHTLWGWLFLAPWVIGTLIYFIYPMIQAIWLVFCDVSFDKNGMVTEFTGFKNISNVFLKDVWPLQCITHSLKGIAIDLIVVLAISILIALLLNQKFRGRAFVRTAFALPVIIGTGILIKVFKSDLFIQSSAMTDGSSTVFQGDALQMILVQAGFPQNFIESVVGMVSSVVDIIWKCGVEILLLLSGLQSIPAYLYEACDIDGATAWQKFWLITFPLMTPFILLSTVYIIIDSATYYDNWVMLEVGWKFDALQYGYSNTLSLAYCMVIGLVVAAVTALISKRVVYLD